MNRILGGSSPRSVLVLGVLISTGLLLQAQTSPLIGNRAMTGGTPTFTPSPLRTFTPTVTPSFTPNSPVQTATATFTPTITLSPTVTTTGTQSPSATKTFTPTITGTPTITYSPTITTTGTQSPSATFTSTRTVTLTPTASPTVTVTFTTTSTPGVFQFKVSPQPDAQGLVHFKWETTFKADEAYLRVFTSGFRLVWEENFNKNQKPDYLQAGVHEETWNGRTDDGRPMPSGYYICFISVTAGKKNYETSAKTDIP